jgi:predicted RNase H-like nuclease (RuvC/YqgF family)
VREIRWHIARGIYAEGWPHAAADDSMEAQASVLIVSPLAEQEPMSHHRAEALADYIGQLRGDITTLQAQLAKAQQRIHELTVKERREFAWAEEYMAKSRHLEFELEASQQRIQALEQAIGKALTFHQTTHIHAVLREVQSLLPLPPVKDAQETS